MKALRIVDGKVYDSEGKLLGDLDHIDENTNTVFIKGAEPHTVEDMARLKDDLARALHDAAKVPFEQPSYQIVNQGPRPKRNGPCPQHPKVKFKNCPCSKMNWKINLVKHDSR